MVVRPFRAQSVSPSSYCATPGDGGGPSRGMRCPLENHILLQYPGVAPEIAEDFAPGIERAFSFTPQEQSYAVDQIEGDVPSFIRGTYYLNGPARFFRGTFRYRHWLDGDGMVCRLGFEGRRVHFANCFVKSEKFAAEEEAGQP